MVVVCTSSYLDTSALPEDCLTYWGLTEYFYISYGSVVGGEREGGGRGRGGGGYMYRTRGYFKLKYPLPVLSLSHLWGLGAD